MPAAPAPAEPEEFDEGMSPSLRARLAKRVKSLFIAASIIAIVVGGVQIAGNMLNLGGATKTAKTSKAEMEQPATSPASRSISAPISRRARPRPRRHSPRRPRLPRRKSPPRRRSISIRAPRTIPRCSIRRL